jgi:plasmid stabilization system protein ParE
LRKYTVIITPAAEADALQAFEFIWSRSPLNAARWLQGLNQVTVKLETFAGHGRAPESDVLNCDLRQVIFKSQRVLYTVDKGRGVVHVHYVWHASRQGMSQLPKRDLGGSGFAQA